MDPTIDLDRVFLHEEKRKDYNDNTISLHGTLYEVPVTLAGSTIKVLYDPYQSVCRPLIFFEGKCCGTADIMEKNDLKPESSRTSKCMMHRLITTASAIGPWAYKLIHKLHALDMPDDYYQMDFLITSDMFIYEKIEKAAYVSLKLDSISFANFEMLLLHL